MKKEHIEEYIDLSQILNGKVVVLTGAEFDKEVGKRKNE